MAAPSKILKSCAGKPGFNEIYEIVRVFTIYNGIINRKVRVTVSRYYTTEGFHYSLGYEIADEYDSWKSIDYGQVINGAESEEITIQTAISFISDAHAPRKKAT
jgi:hypothetical protein